MSHDVPVNVNENGKTCLANRNLVLNIDAYAEGGEPKEEESLHSTLYEPSSDPQPDPGPKVPPAVFTRQNTEHLEKAVSTIMESLTGDEIQDVPRALNNAFEKLMLLATDTRLVAELLHTDNNDLRNNVSNLYERFEQILTPSAKNKTTMRWNLKRVDGLFKEMSMFVLLTNEYNRKENHRLSIAKQSLNTLVDVIDKRFVYQEHYPDWVIKIMIDPNGQPTHDERLKRATWRSKSLQRRENAVRNVVESSIGVKTLKLLIADLQATVDGEE
jgi:hypothetical protein